MHKAKCARLLGRIWSNLDEAAVWLPPQSTPQSWKLFLLLAAASQKVAGVAAPSVLVAPPKGTTYCSGS